MRSLFPGQFRPSIEGFQSRWANCIFAVDANVLLSLSRQKPLSPGFLPDAMRKMGLIKTRRSGPLRYSAVGIPILCGSVFWHESNPPQSPFERP